jgi:hypothetical protein
MRAIPWQRYLLMLVLAVLIGGGIAWFFYNFDKVETTRHVGYSAEARNDRWLAMARFLSRSGAEVQRLTMSELFERELPLDITLLSNGLHEVLSIERQERIWAWLNDGGQMVAIVPRYELDEDEYIFLGGFYEDLGLYIEASLEGDDEPTVFSFDEDETDISVRFNTGERYQYLSMDGTFEPSGSLGSEGRFDLIQYEIGDGRLTVLASGSMLTNHELEAEDHAWFVHQLAGVQHGAKVWLAYHRQWPSLGQWLWRHAYWVIVLLALLLVLWLWRCNLRMGTLLQDDTQERRHLGEHLQASADFLWRHRSGEHMVQASKDRVRQRWLQHHSKLCQLEVQQQWQWIVQHSGLSTSDQQMLCHEGRYSERDLLRLTQLLQRLMWMPETRPLADP